MGIQEEENQVVTLEELQQYAFDFREGMLEGKSSQYMCRAVCAPLQSLLEVMEIPCRLTELLFHHVNHYVIELPDGNIIDPTADQFGLEKVYVGSMPDKYIEWMKQYTDP